MQSIIIADAHSLCREALCEYIRQSDPEYQIGGASDYQTLVEQFRETTPSLILIDTDLPGLAHGEGIGEALKNFDGVKLGMIVPIVRTEFSWTEPVKGIFPKSLSCKAFAGGIREILAGNTFFPSLAENMYALEDLGGAAKLGPRDFNLTAREKEVLNHLVKGASNKDIARALDLQVVTVKLHVRGICRKMKAANRTQAALIAKEHGWG